MKRGSPLKRTPFRTSRKEGPTTTKEPRPWAEQLVAASRTLGLHKGTYAGTTGPGVSKENASQSEAYMAAVRGLGYCMLCKRACRPQFCHADQGKGTGIKTDVRRGWPGCGPGDHGPGCHWIVGTSGQYEKADRRILEERLARQTRAAVNAAGAWPKPLAQWSEA